MVRDFSRAGNPRCTRCGRYLTAGACTNADCGQGLKLFLARVRHADGGCWEWMGKRYPNGYGCVKRDGRERLAHRYSYQVHVGVIPDGLVVCHRCDNRICVNPAHLFVGTTADNLADMDRKGRRVSVPRPGEMNCKAKLTEGQVRQIRALRGLMLGTEIATQFGVSPTAVARIQLGRTWAHVE